MTEQERALRRLAAFLDRQQVPYVVIGGLAVAVWGDPRATLDIDTSIWVPEDSVESFVLEAGNDFELLVDNPEAFVEETRVLPLRSAEGVRIDLIFGQLPFEKEAIERGIEIETGTGSVRFCTAEDLILMKILSDRDRDQSDARGVTLRRMKQLDLEYLEPRLRELANLLNKPTILKRWEAWREEAEG